MGARAWTPEEDAALIKNYSRHTSSWPGWDSVLPGRSRWSRTARARKLGAQGRQGPRDDGPRTKPETCGACRFYLDNERTGVGRCMERHARTLFGKAPTVKAEYPTTTCEWGEARA